MFRKKMTMTDAPRPTLRAKLSELIKFSVGALLLFTAAAGVHAQTGTGPLKNTGYDISVGDVNGDGREDIFMKAVPRVLMIPLDDDMTIPIAIPPKTPSFALMSDQYWGYVLVSNPDPQLTQMSWSAASGSALQFGAHGPHADTVRITSGAGEFIVAFSDVSRQLSLVQLPGLVKAPGTITYIHTDGLGSPAARTNAAGQLVSRTLYEPYGYVAMGETPTVGFTGHVNDSNTGLTYMQQRYYDPVAGRFLSIDPVVVDSNTGSSFNRYAYAVNNPYKYVDPDGRQIDNPRDIFRNERQRLGIPDECDSACRLTTLSQSGDIGSDNFSTSGKGPNERGNFGVEVEAERLSLEGFRILRSEVVAWIPGTSLTRRWDLVVQNRLSGSYFGVEVKTSLFDIFKLDLKQVSFDILAVEKGAMTELGIKVNGVMYRGVGFGSGPAAAWNSLKTYNALKAAGVSFDVTRTKYP